MSEQGKIKRGEKWVKLKAINPNAAAWYSTQPAILADIEAYENSIKVEEPIKSKGKK